MLKDPPPTKPKQTRKKQTRPSVTEISWQKNYINEYSKLFQKMQEIDEENRQLRDVVEMQSKKLKDLGRITKKNATSDFSCQFSTATCDFPCQYSSATCDFSTQFSPEMCDFSCVVYPNLNEDKVEDHLPATFHNDSAVKNDISADVGFGDGTEAETSGSFSQQTTNASPFALPSANNQTNKQSVRWATTATESSFRRQCNI